MRFVPYSRRWKKKCTFPSNSLITIRLTTATVIVINSSLNLVMFFSWHFYHWFSYGDINKSCFFSLMISLSPNWVKKFHLIRRGSFWWICHHRFLWKIVCFTEFSILKLGLSPLITGATFKCKEFTSMWLWWRWVIVAAADKVLLAALSLHSLTHVLKGGVAPIIKKVKVLCFVFIYSHSCDDFGGFFCSLNRIHQIWW